MISIERPRKIRLQKNQLLLLSKLKRDIGIPIKQLSRVTGLSEELTGYTLRRLRKRNLVWCTQAKIFDPALHSQSLLWYLNG